MNEPTGRRPPPGPNEAREGVTKVTPVRRTAECEFSKSGKHCWVYGPRCKYCNKTRKEVRL